MVSLRKLAGGFFTALVITGLFLGCSKQAAVPNAGKSSLGDNFNPTGLPIVKDPVELSVLTMRWGHMGDTFKQNKWLIDLEPRTNVKVNWQVVLSTGWTEQKSILLASGSLPDIIMGNATFGDADIMNNLEYFLPLDDLIDKYMPNYKDAMAKVPALRSIATYPDGKLYTFAKIMPARPMISVQPVINKAWLDRLGLGIPSNINELTTVLKAFKTRDANGNGDPNDEFPLSYEGSIDRQFLAPFGITDINGTWMTVKDGTPYFFPAMNEYRAACKYLRELWEAGCIDPESFTQDNTMLNGKRLNPQAPQVGMSYQWTPDAVYGKWSNQYIAIPPIAGPDGKAYAGSDPNGYSSVMRNEAEITKFCKYPEVAARWLDQWYNSEASIQNFWGAIGVVITKNSDGTYTLNDPPAGVSADAWYWDQSLRDFGPKYIEPGFNDKLKLNPQMGDGLKMEIAKMAYPYMVESYPRVVFTLAETEELASLETDLISFVNQTQARWVTQGGIDANWDAYIRQLETMGLKRYVDIKTGAYNRYKGK